MEHRWGERFPVELAVRLHSGSTTILDARLADASVSGALVNTGVRLPVFSHVIVEFEIARRSGAAGQRVPAYVVRHTPEGLGLEWQEFAPRPIVSLLETALRGRHAVLTALPRRGEFARPTDRPG
jgi:PilZ domain-containing protein